MREDRMIADICPPDVISKLHRLTFGTCDCNTKTPELRYHGQHCVYRLASEIVDLLATTPVPSNAQAPANAIPTGDTP